ncbi:NAD(P)/FAD-dependent oxidoreductase [Mesorhizobium sp. CAU 1732]|uniref:NAD(P)/FAD-dependent oxidoreductase n=1 Tax=Mesorhizobium sp. CAU 1732 TaxID=3140358 RepID=UPI0032602BEC
MKRHHVVVVGAGFAGLEVVRALSSSGVQITLIDQCNHHLFQPFLYQVATSILAPSEIAWPIRGLFERRTDVTTILASVIDVKADKKAVILEDGTPVAYDSLVLATGARHAYFGNDQWEEFAPGLKSLEDATTIRERILIAFERAEREPDPAKRRAFLTFGVIGGGPTGVELAGTIAELAKIAMRREFRRIDTREARVLLIEAGPRVLPTFREDLSEYALQALAKCGVEVRCGVPVTECSEEGLRLGDEFIACRTAIWAAGVSASPAHRWLHADCDRVGRVTVDANLHLPDRPDIFVIGDTASVMGENGCPVPGIAPAAKQQGKHVARVLRARLRKMPAPKPFHYRHLGDLATIGRGSAVIDMGRIRLRGRIAWWIWGIAHIYFLIGARSRAAVAWSWIWTHLRGQHSARLIVRQEYNRSAPYET